MSIRRKAGDRVWLMPGAGFCGKSDCLIVTIQPQDAKYEMPCMLSCGDDECREWVDVWTDPDPEANGQRHSLYHVSECQMLDVKYNVGEKGMH